MDAVIEEAVGPMNGKRIPTEQPVAVRFKINDVSYREVGYLPDPDGFYSFREMSALTFFG